MRQTKFRDIEHFKKHTAWTIKAHEKFSQKLKESGLTEDHRENLLGASVDASKEALIANYTIGTPIVDLEKYNERLINDLVSYLKETGDDLTSDGDLEWYINCLWILSFCYFFNVSKDIVQLIADHISLTGKDWLVDRLVAASIPGHPISVGQLSFPKVYQPLADALSFDQTTKERTEKIQVFLKNYYLLLKKYDVTWHNSHKEPDPEYCIHFGYWIFELAALAADIGWDDSAYRDHEMYPKDLVDWKFAQRPKDEQKKI